MQKNLLVILFCLWSVAAVQAQITVSNATFPVVGDLLLTMTDNSGANAEITNEGANQNWNFSNLELSGIDTINILPANQGSAGSSFPNADIVLPAFGGEAYVRKNTNSLEVLGLVADLGFGTPFVVNYSPSLIYRETPMDYLNSRDYFSAFSIAFAPSDYPTIDSLLGTVGGDLIDSLRITVNSEREDDVDAWGTLTTPAGEYNVLRMKQTDYQETILEAYVPIFGWTDLGTFIPDLPFGGLDTIITYEFLNDESKVSIATINMEDETTIGSVNYKAPSMTAVNIIPSLESRADIQAAPNPAIVDVTFTVRGIKAGKYRISLYNIIGGEVWSKEYHLIDGQQIQLSVNDFKKGTYLYSLSTENGIALMTKRIMIIKP